MSHAMVPVRIARPDDFGALAEMWLGVRDSAPWADRLFPAPASADLQRRLAEAQRDPHRRIVVAEIGTEIAGTAVFSNDPLAPFVDHDAVQVSYLLVRDGFRRRGVGRALLAAATAYAEEVDADHVVVDVSPALREANRFYARLGLKPMYVRRVAAVAGLRRRLGLEVHPAGAAPGDVRRQSIRARSRARMRAALARPSALS